MVHSWIVLAFSLGYVGILFALAYHGDKRAKVRGRRAAKPVIYALSLAVYCTSWTFYGSVGLSAKTGYTFLTIYIGPILMFALGWPLLLRIIRISKAHNITSIADFIAARYGKSQMLAAAVTVIAVVGTLPYIALQLKAVSASFTVLTHHPGIALPSRLVPSLSGYTELVVALTLSLFAILFGTRHIDATEHHNGLILAIAFESTVKLMAFLGVGAFVTWGMFDGFGDLFRRAGSEPALRSLFFKGVDGTSWVTMTTLALTAVLCLPRQFHVAIVENANEGDLRRAAWLFPLYLIAINVFVVPIAIAGLTVFPKGTVDGDMFVLALPMAAGQAPMALLAYIGGLSAATGMVIVSSVALSTMVSNDLVMPIVLHGRRLGLAEREDMSGLIRHIRRAAILAVMLLAYYYDQLAGDTLPLASIGLLSFAAMAQFAPSLLGGLIWRSANAKGALAGIIAGFLVWAYTLLLPSLAHSGFAPHALLENGPFGTGILRPQQLFGLRFDPLTHGVFWSLLVNIGAYVTVSLLSASRVIERIQASAFIDADGEYGQLGGRAWHGSIRVSELAAVVARYLGLERARRAFAELAARRDQELAPAAQADFQLVRQSERLLASAIGAPSARLVMGLTLERRNLGIDAAMRLLDDATAAIQYNRDLLYATIENVRQGISVFDRNLRLVCWNRHFRDLLDLPPELGRVGVRLQEILRFIAARGDYGPGNVEDLAARQIERVISSGETVFEQQRPNGRVLEIRTNPMPGGSYVTTYSDISEHVQATAQLAAANELLEQRVKERTAELTQLNVELSRAKVVAEEADLGKTRFLAAASHDLLQPLNAARLYVATLLDRRGDGGTSQPTDGELVRKIDGSLGSVEELLGALLDISRLDAGALVAERQGVDLGELFHALKVEFAPIAERKGLRFIVVPTTLAVESDRRLLHRVLQNLLSNAVRYTPAGKVLMGVRPRGTEVLVQVIDTGYGIARDKQELVFQEFQRLSPGPGTEQGLGLGLSIVERISRLLDHQVSFRSELGRGTTFTLRLPRGSIARTEHQPPAPALRSLPALDGTLVLCVDNEPSMLDGMKALLEGWGCRTLLAAGPDEALEAAAGGMGPPSIALIDYHLGPGGDGIEFAARLRTAWHGSVPAILITADRSDAVKAAARAHDLPALNKPVKPAALRALMMRILAMYEAAE